MAAHKHTFLRWIHETVGSTARWASNLAQEAKGKKHYFTRLLSSIALMGDHVAEGTRQAVRARFLLDDTPDDYLPYLGGTRAIHRLTSETTSSYRTILGRQTNAAPRGAWVLNLLRGSPQGVVRNLARMQGVYGFDGSGPWGYPIDLTGDLWWRVYEYPSTPELFQYAIKFNVSPMFMPGSYWVGFTYGVDAPDYGPNSEGESWVYGSQIAGRSLAEIRAIAEEWAPARSKLVSIEGDSW